MKDKYFVEHFIKNIKMRKNFICITINISNPSLIIFLKNRQKQFI